MIPSQLALDFSMQSSNLVTIPLPSRPASHCSAGDPSPRHGDVQLPPTSHLGSTASSHPLSNACPSLPHLLLHAYADRFSSASHSIAASAASRRQRNMARGVEQRQRYDMLHAELDEAVRGWAIDLRARAGLASAVGNLWGWECAMDQQAAKTLQSQLPFFEERIQSFDDFYDADWHAVVGVTMPPGERWDPEIEYRRQQVAFARGEAIVELRKVKARLGLDQPTDESILGVLEMGTWVGRV